MSGEDKEAEAIKEYNLGFAAKYRGDWQASLKHNQRAALLNGDDEATWWNLGIAATALSDWPEARRHGRNVASRICEVGDWFTADVEGMG